MTNKTPSSPTALRLARGFYLYPLASMLLGVGAFMIGAIVSSRGIPTFSYNQLYPAFIMILAGFAIFLSTTSILLTILQMEQVEENRSTDLALAQAISALTNELRRQPTALPQTTFALFAVSGESAKIAYDQR